MMLASAGLASANRGLPMNEAARLSRQSGQLPTPSSVIPAEQTGLLKSPHVDTGLLGAARARYNELRFFASVLHAASSA